MDLAAITTPFLLKQALLSRLFFLWYGSSSVKYRAWLALDNTQIHQV
jgi:hypothetical protein